MSSIDERLVNLRFENSQFERGVRTSLDSLDKLKKGLNLDESARSLSNLEQAGRKFSLNGIAENVQNISNKFSEFGIIGVTTLVNLTNTAVNAGKRIVSALTIDPIKTGLQEYETKMNAITTILTNTKSKGTTLDDVNAALAELNEYADKTIYNFAEMTRNIGTFTAAGIDLKTATLSIKGIANLAAGSGSTAQQASTAMYQLSQALASGTVKLMDWNSVVNAGMGGELFQNALKQSAKELGVFVDASKPFRETLQDGWLTADVLTRTLSKFASDEDLIKAATQVKTFTQLLDTMKESVQSGWAVTWENIIGDKDQAAKTLTSINDAFGALVGPIADSRNEMLKFWNVNGGRDALINGITNAVKGLTSVLRPIREAFREVFPAMTGERLVAITKSFESLTEKFKMGDKSIDAIKITFKGLFSILDIAAQIISTVVRGFATLFGVVLPAGNGVLFLTSSIGEFLIKTHDAIEASGILSSILEGFQKILKPIPNMFKGVGKIGSIFYNLANGIGKAFETISKHVTNGLESFSFDKLFALINGGLFATILFSVKKFIASLTSIVEEGHGFLSGITEIFDGVKGCLVAYQSQLKAGTLLKIASAIGILSASLVALSLINPDRLASALSGITMLFTELLISMSIFNKVAIGTKLKGTFLLTGAMIGLSTAILILSGAMTILSKLDWSGIAKGLVSVAGLSAILIASAKALSATKGQLIKGAMGYVIFATSILILTKAVENISSIDTKGLIKGLVGVGALMAELALFMKVTNIGRMGIRSGIGIVLLSSAILILSNAVNKFGAMDSNALIKGLGSIGILLSQLVLFSTLSGGNKIIGMSIGLNLIASSMLIFAKAIKNMGGMSLETIGKGLLTLAASLTIIGVAMHFMKTALPGATALLVIAGSLAILAPMLKLLGSMSMEQIGKSLLTLVGVFTVFGATSVLLAPLIPALLGVAGAIALLGAGCLAVGGGILALSMGLTGLAAAGTAGAVALVAMVSSIIGLIPFLLTEIGKGILAFANVISEGAPALLKAITTVIFVLLDALQNALPKMIDIGIKIVLGLVEGIKNTLPKLVQAAFDLIITFINSLANAIRDNSKALTDAFINLGDAMIGGLIKSITGGIGKAVGAIKNVGSNLISGFKDTLDIHSPSKVFGDAGKNIIDGLTNGILKNAPKAIAATDGLASSLPTDNYDAAGQNAGNAYATGVTKSKKKAKKAGKDLVEETLKGIRETSSVISVENGKYVVDGVIIGMVSKQPDVNEASKLLALAISNGLVNEEARFKDVGATDATTFLKGLSDQEIIDKAWAAGVTVSSSAWEGAKTTAEQMEAAGTAAGQAYIDGLNTAAKKALELQNRMRDQIHEMAASGELARRRSESIKAEREAAEKAGLQFGFTMPADMTEAEKNAYYGAGEGTAGYLVVESMREAGKNASEGFADGLESGVNEVVKAVNDLTSTVVNTTKDNLDINSPSKVFSEIGKFSILGFSNGLKNYAYMASDAAKRVGNYAVQSLKSSINNINEIINSSMNTDPTIRPVLDLTDIENNVKRMNGLLSTSQNLINTNQQLISLSSNMQSKDNLESVKQTAPTAYSFVQNNYSPVPLSRLEIYRQTKNQFSALKGLVTN